MPVAVITGASLGLGRALARGLAERGWDLVIDGRDAAALEAATEEMRRSGAGKVTAIAGDVADDTHRRALVGAAGDRLDLLVNNASTLGPSPQPGLGTYPLDILERVYRVNTIAPL